MNFNIDFIQPLRLIGNDFRNIAKYSLFLTVIFGAFITLFGFNIHLYGSSKMLSAMLLSIFLVVAFFLVSLFVAGYNIEIAHNFILEKQDFMPSVKGRINEYLKYGFNTFLLSLVVFIPLCLVIVLFGYFINIEILENVFFVFLTTFLFSYLPNIFFTPFFMAFAHKKEFSAFFKKDNVVFFQYSIPELTYSYLASIVASYVSCILYLIVSFVLLLPLFAIVLFKAFLVSAIFNVLFAILIMLLILFALYVCILFAVITVNYTISLFAQSYNYGKYFCHMGEAPKRKAKEWVLVAIALFIILSSSFFPEVISDKIEDIMENNKIEKIFEDFAKI